MGLYDGMPEILEKTNFVLVCGIKWKMSEKKVKVDYMYNGINVP